MAMAMAMVMATVMGIDLKRLLNLTLKMENTLCKESMDTEIHQLLDFETFRILKWNQKAPEGYT